jgi:anti-sigma28 factor (negative regulator of flagellin synthesis)
MGISPLGDNFAPASDVRSSQDVRSGQVEQAQQIAQQRQDRTRRSEPPGDSVSLSSLGSELARSLATESSEEVRRVDELQQAVNNGTLRAASREAAERVVDEALHGEPLSPRPGVVAPASPA